MAATSSAAPLPAAHPTYDKMIVTAILSLNNPTGSSRQSIAKFIADNYTGLPVGHDALLTHHLRRLVLTNVLYMVKHSYKVTGVTDDEGDIVVPATPVAKKGQTGLELVQSLAKTAQRLATAAVARFASEAAHVVDTGVKRKRGRLPVVRSEGSSVAVSVGKKRGRPRKDSNAAAVALAPAAVALAPAAGVSATRKRGRPRKVTSAVTPAAFKDTTAVVAAAGQEQPPKADGVVVPTARPGVGSPLKAADGEQQTSAKRRGRPPKQAGAQLGSVKRRGRPPLSPASKIGRPPVAMKTNEGTAKRSVGRPRKVHAETETETNTNNAAVETTVVPHAEKRKPGRRRKVSVEPTGDQKGTAAAEGQGEVTVASGAGNHGRSEEALTDGAAQGGSPAVTPKRGRGRPPLNKCTMLSEAKEAEVVKETVDKVIKQQVSDVGARDGVVAPEAAKDEGPVSVKRRGRPAKKKEAGKLLDEKKGKIKETEEEGEKELEGEAINAKETEVVAAELALPASHSQLAGEACASTLEV